MFADMDPEARVWAILAALLAVFVVVLLVSLLSAWKEADTADDNRRAAQRFAIDETARADEAEERLATLCRRHTETVDQAYARTLWGRDQFDAAETIVMAATTPMSVDTLVMTAAGAILGDPT